MAQSKDRTFAVRGAGEFPRDMLRYDECAFASPQDEDQAGVGYVSGKRTVSLVLTDAKRSWLKPTVARWDSFGWKVLSGSPGAEIYAAAERRASPEPKDIDAMAVAFTLTVERFLRSGDGSDPRTPPTEAEVVQAMYALRAAIAKRSTLQAEVMPA